MVLELHKALIWKLPKAMIQSEVKGDFKTYELYNYVRVTSKVKFEAINICGIIRQVELVSP